MANENSVGGKESKVKSPCIEIKIGPGTTLQKAAWYKLWGKLLAGVNYGERNDQKHR